MKLKILTDPQDKNLFWIFYPDTGKGQWCRANRNDILEDRANSMFFERSPECYQKAYKIYLSNSSIRDKRCKTT